MTAKRTFTHLAAAWYADANLRNRADGLVDDFICHFDGAEGSEISIRWDRLQHTGEVLCKLEVYDDAWTTLAAIPDLVAALATMKPNPKPQAVRAMLVSLGFEDITPTVSPYAVDCAGAA